MTYETCIRLAEHFKSIGNTEEAKIYEAKAERRLKHSKYQDIASKTETKSTGKK